MSRYNVYRYVSNRFPNTSIILSVLMLSFGGCVRYEAEPVDPQQLMSEWESIDALTANLSVNAALQLKQVEPTTTYNLADGISLEEAEITALFFNPSIRLTRLRIGIPAAEAKFAKLWQDPELGIDGEYVLENVEKPLIIGAGLSITIPLSGRLGVAKELALDKISEAEIAATGAEWALLNSLHQQWVELAAYNAREKMCSDTLKLMDHLVQVGAKFKAAQIMTIVEERLLLLQQKQAELALMTVRSELTAQKQQIIMTLGLHPEGDWNLDMTMPKKPVAESIEDYLSIVQEHPQLRLALAAYAIAERQLALEVRKQYPDLSLGFGLGSDQGENRFGFGLGLLPIPIWNANKAGIAQASVERQVAAVQIDQALKELVYSLARQRQHSKSLQQKHDFFREYIIPLSNQQLEDAKQLLGTGNLDMFLLVNALEVARQNQVTLLEYEVAEIKNAFSLQAFSTASTALSSGLNTDKHIKVGE